MGATDRYSLIVESTTRGEAALRTFEQTMNRIAETAERTQKRTASATVSGGNDLKQFAANLRSAIQNPLAAAGEAAENFVLRFGKVGIVAGGVAAGLGIASVAAFKLVQSTGAAAEQLQNLADRTGLTLSQTDRLSASAKIAGVSIESLAVGSKTLAQLLGSTNREGEKAREAMFKLGVSFFDGADKERELGQVTLELIERLGSMKSQTEQLILTNKAFGRSAVELLPLIKNYKEFDEIVRRLGFGSRDSLLKALQAADTQLDILSAKFTLLRGELAEPILVSVKFASDVLDLLKFVDKVQRAVIGQSPVGFRPSLEPRTPTDLTASLLAERERRARSFAAIEAGTPEGRRRRIADIEEEISGLRTRGLSGIDVDSQLSRLRTEKQSLEASLDALTAIPRFLVAINRETKQIIEELRKESEKRFEKVFEGRPSFLQVEAQTAAAALSAGRLQQAGGVVLGQPVPVPFGAEIGIARAKGEQGVFERNQRRTLEITRQAFELEQRRVDLVTAPGGEVAALNRITELKLQSLDIQKQIGSELDLQAEKSLVIQERELQLLELQRRRLNEFKENVGRAFDALVSRGGGGFGDFARAQLFGLGRTITTNVGGEFFRSVSGRFTLPGQIGAGGQPTLLGRVLAGTPFGDSGLKTATELNTLATTDNTLALRAATLGGGGTNGLGLPTGLFGGAGQNPLIFSATGGANRVPLYPGGPTVDVSSIIKGGTINPDFRHQYGTTAQTSAVYAAAVAGGAVAVKEGARMGGGRGFLTGAAGALGTAAVLDPEPISKAVLAIAAVAAGIAAQVFPDPKRKRAEELERLIGGARYTGPESAAYDLDLFGREYDYNAAGGMRPIPIVVQAMDSQSFIDHADDIADALQRAMIRQHPVNRTAREVTLGF